MPLGTRLITEKRRSVRSELAEVVGAFDGFFRLNQLSASPLREKQPRVKCLPGHLNFW